MKNFENLEFGKLKESEQFIKFGILEKLEKKDVNRDSHIASSPISQSSFFKGVVRLIRAKKSIFSIIFFKDTINIYLFI